MQLFITPYKEKNGILQIENKEILNQIRKVLRLKKGDTIFIQDKKIRYEVKITDWDATTITGEIYSKKENANKEKETTLIVCMPNKWDKIELVVQKLTEIGISKIIFRPSERSIIKEWNVKKEERLNKIAKEAVEQSRGWNIPTIIFTKNISELIKNKKISVFDVGGTKEKIDTSIGIVGPEGGLTPHDYKIFGETTHTIQSLGATIVRTETAAIIAGRQIKNA